MQVDEVPVPQPMQQLKSLVGTESTAALHIGATGQDGVATVLTIGLARVGLPPMLLQCSH